MRTSKPPLLVLAVAFACLPACASLFSEGTDGTSSGAGGNPRSGLSGTRVDTCKPLGVTWELPGQVQNVEVFRNAGRWVLVYETLMRVGARTVWQPLSTTLATDGDGIAVGERKLPFIADFHVQNDAPGNTWVQYRAKRPGSELYSAYVEMLDAREADKLRRVRLPTTASESVQEAWLLPLSGGMASVVLRVNPYGGAGDETTLFRWYSVNMMKEQGRALGEFRQTGDVLSSARFVPLAKTGEPVAISIVSRNQDFAASDAKYQRASFRLIAKRIFSKAREELVLLDSQAPLTGLTIDARPAQTGPASASQSLLLAWLQEPSGGTGTLVQWLSLRFAATEKGFTDLKKMLATKGAPRPPVKGLEVSHDPVRLHFRPMVAGGGKGVNARVGLSWWTASDDDSGFLLTQVQPPLPDITLADGHDSRGQPRKKTRPPLLAVYSPDRKARIVGVAEGAGPQGQDVLLALRSDGEKSIEKGSRITLCAVNPQG